VKVKLDENLPARLVRLLAELGHDADTVPQEGLQEDRTPTSGLRLKLQRVSSSRKI
jgi:predicted nuclease of predicted toxin-antitoxin system